MILISTLRRLAAQGATIYRVDSPAFTTRVPGLPPSDIPAKLEFFSTRRQADHVASMETATLFGAPNAPTVKPIPAVEALRLDPMAVAIYGEPTITPTGIVRAGS